MIISRQKLLGLIFFSLTFILAGLLFFPFEPLILEFQSSSSPSPEAEKPIQIIFVGDVMLDRGVEYQIEKKEKGNFNFPFLKIADELKKADLVFANLESQISDQGENVGSIYSFRAKPEALEGLKSAGFSILSLANNHALDYGRKALEDSLKRLTEGGLSPVGAGNEAQAYAPLIKTVRGTRIAFFAYTDQGPETWQAKGEVFGIARVSDQNISKIKEDIKLAKELADIVIVSLHAGDEYETQANQSQTSFARSFIDAGADLVVGSHPHVVQGSEDYQGKKIFYSLGNFIFDQKFSEPTMEGQLLRVRIEGNEISKLDSAEIKEITEEKIKINGSFQPELEK